METSAGRPADSVTLLELDGELSLFDTRTGTAMVLNRTAADVLALADGRTTVGEIIDTLAGAYAVAAEEIGPGVRAVLGELARSGVLVDAPE